MELTQQVKNFHACQAHSSLKRPSFKREVNRQDSHQAALQLLSNGNAVPYSSTLRVVQHEGSRAPKVSPAKTQKPPGFCRNEGGGVFTS